MKKDPVGEFLVDHRFIEKEDHDHKEEVDLIAQKEEMLK